MLTLTELGEPGFRIIPCIFPAYQGSTPRDEFAPDSPHLLGVRLGVAGLAIDFFPDGRWFALETSCPPTPSAAIESADAETSPHIQR
jgi:hypothetical protein